MVTAHTRKMARKSDAETSVLAAQAILPAVSDLQKQILRIIREHHRRTGDGMTDRELVKHPELCRLPNGQPRPEQSVRKRRTELYQAGYLQPTGETRERCQIWIPVPLMDTVRAAEARRDGLMF